MIVTFHQGSFFVALFFGERFDIFVADGGERVGAPVLVGRAGLGDGVCLVVAFFADILAEFLVIVFVAVFALYERAYFLCELHLSLALLLDGIVSGLECSEKVGFRHFVHFAFHHHDIVVGGAYHQLHVGVFKLLECGVDDKLAVDASHTHFRDRSVEMQPVRQARRACQRRQMNTL